MPLLNGQGAGAAGAGLAPAGHDLPEDPGLASMQTPNAANEFDPYLRVWTQESDLSMRATSSVIQRAATLMLPLGAIASTPTNGIDLDGIRRSNPSNRLTTVRSALDRAWESLIDTGELTIVSLELETGEPWSGRWFVTVRDNTTSQQQTLGS